MTNCGCGSSKPKIHLKPGCATRPVNYDCPFYLEQDHCGNQFLKLDFSGLSADDLAALAAGLFGTIPVMSNSTLTGAGTQQSPLGIDISFVCSSMLNDAACRAQIQGILSVNTDQTITGDGQATALSVNVQAVCAQMLVDAGCTAALNNAIDANQICAVMASNPTCVAALQAAMPALTSDNTINGDGVNTPFGVNVTNITQQLVNNPAAFDQLIAALNARNCGSVCTGTEEITVPAQEIDSVASGAGIGQIFELVNAPNKPANEKWDISTEGVLSISRTTNEGFVGPWPSEFFGANAIVQAMNGNSVVAQGVSSIVASESDLTAIATSGASVNIDFEIPAGTPVTGFRVILADGTTLLSGDNENGHHELSLTQVVVTVTRFADKLFT